MKDSTVLELNWSEKANSELKISILLTTLLKYEKSQIFKRLKISQQADLPKLNEAIRVEGNEREEVDTAMMKRYTEELNKLNETIQNERKNREESETAIYDMLKDVVSKVKAEIDTEKKER